MIFVHVDDGNPTKNENTNTEQHILHTCMQAAAIIISSVDANLASKRRRRSEEDACYSHDRINKIARLIGPAFLLDWPGRRKKNCTKIYCIKGRDKMPNFEIHYVQLLTWLIVFVYCGENT